MSSEIIKTLLGREWIREVGRRDVPGRPALYGTTRGFLEHFNLKGLDELPPLAELRDVDKIAAELNLRLPVDEEPAVPAPDSAGADESADSPERADDAAPASEAAAGTETPAALEARSDEGGNPPATL